MDGFYGWSESRDASFREARESAVRALALDEHDTLALRAIGLVHFFSKDHDVALSYYERAVAANPNEAENRALLGAALGVAGNYDAALEQFETALRLSPRDVNIATWYGYLAVAAFVAGRDAEAAEWARKAVAANPQFPGGLRTLAASAGNLGRLTEAETARERLQELLPHVTIAQLRENLPYFKDPDDLERYLEGLRRAGLPEGASD
jgi:adenylate cyclase